MTRQLALLEGIFCGISSGCNVAAAIKLAKEHKEFVSIVTMINDSGQHYFSTELWGKRREVQIPSRVHPLEKFSITELDKCHKNWEILE